MCMIDGAESVSFCSTTVRTARKTHICSECDRAIHAREQYTYSSYKHPDWDCPETNKRCSHCQYAVNWLNKHCGGFCFGAVKAEIVDHHEEEYFDDDFLLIKTGICRQWQSSDGDGLLPVPDIFDVEIAA
jgi:hypothetical protein